MDKTMADTQEFLDKLYVKYVEQGIDWRDFNLPEPKELKKFKQAILQHFQQEQERLLNELRKIHKIQKECGSLEDQYMLGLYNGLEMALSIAEGRDPIFESGEKKEPTYTQSEVDR